RPVPTLLILGAPLALGCAGPAVRQPSPAPVMVAPAPSTSASDEPASLSTDSPPAEVAIAVAPKAALPVFHVKGASKTYDFTLTFDDACGEPEKGEACSGHATLLVARKDGASSQTIAVKDAWVRLGSNGEPLVNATELYGEQGTI